ncbi:MAG: hypothetical protein M0R80_20395 [Proteobacteria bacterium]|jgi:hypothetical protein|nr:hypothetical protein [Pseudomonadota bacterium]
MRSRFVLLALFAGASTCAGCWDQIVHEMDCNDTGGSTDVDTDSDSDSDADAAPGDGQGDVPPGWEGFGAACETDEDCNGYPGSAAFPRCCLTDVLGLINAPGGFCTACCNAEEIDGCADNIDCVGANNAYTICLAHCDSNADCRLDEGWECRGLYYIPENFPGTFCLPDADHVEVDTEEQPLDDPHCPWPWL